MITKSTNKIFLLILIIFCALIILAPTSFACDPLGCLLSGHDQDALVLGEVTAKSEDSWNINIFFVFPQSNDKNLKIDDQIAVQNLDKAINLSTPGSGNIVVGNKYLMSLNKDTTSYLPAWGVFEITGTDYANAKLVKNESIDDEALQIFINSGGTENNFAFDYSGDKPILIRNDFGKNIARINDNKLWYGIGFGLIVLGSTGLSIFFIKKTKHV